MNFNFVDDELNGHEVRIRPGFLKQSITIDGKKVPKKFLKMHIPFVNTWIENYDGERTKSIIVNRDKICSQKDKILVNDHEI